MALAAPILPITMSGFIANDINDVEKDTINHPSRPLPRKQIRITTAVFVYFLLMSLALVLVKINVSGVSIFYYIVLLLGFINYKYIVDHFAWLKNAYVATIGAIPILIAIDSSGLSPVYYWGSAAFVLFMMGRELLMDTRDADGDADSLALRIGIKRSTVIAFSLQLLGLCALVPLSTTTSKSVLLLGLFVLTFAFVVLWRSTRTRGIAVMAIKYQMFLGLVFLT